MWFVRSSEDESNKETLKTWWNLNTLSLYPYKTLAVCCSIHTHSHCPMPKTGGSVQDGGEGLYSDARSKTALILQLLKRTWILFTIYLKKKQKKTFLSCTTTCPGCVRGLLCESERSYILIILLHCNRKRIQASAFAVVTVSSLATPIKSGKLVLPVFHVAYWHIESNNCSNIPDERLSM